MVQEILDMGINQPIQSAFSSLVVLIINKDRSWCMCPNYIKLNKMEIKDKFHILVIDELLDELHGEIFFTTLELHFEYHQIKMT